MEATVYDEQLAETIVLSDEGRNKTAFWIRLLCDCLSGKRSFDPIDVMENVIPLFDPSFNYRVLETGEWRWGELLPAFYNAESNEIVIRQDVYDGAIWMNPLDVITVAHEVVHCIQSIMLRFLRAIDCVDFKTELCRADSKELEHHEIQTDVITALVLFPDQLVKGLSEEEIERKYFIGPLMQLLCGIIRMASSKLLEFLDNMQTMKEVERCAV